MIVVRALSWAVLELAGLQVCVPVFVSHALELQLQKRSFREPEFEIEKPRDQEHVVVSTNLAFLR